MHRALSILAILSVSALLASAGQASSGPPPVTACTLGTLSAENLRAETAVLAAARSRFERSLGGTPRSAAHAAGASFVTDLAAWLYGFPIELVRRTISTFPVNQMVSIGKLADTSTQTVVAPNHDTLYSVAQVDLTAGPVVIQTPSTAGRYSVIQLIDGFTNAAAYVGDGPAARTGEAVALVAPSWHGSLPAGLRVVRPATKLLWLLGRTLATNAPDEAVAGKLLARYSLTPLADYVAGTRRTSLVLPGFPAGRKPVTVAMSTSFYDELGTVLAADPPPARDRCAVAAFARAGIGPGKTPSTALTGLSARALSAAAAAGHGVLEQLIAAARRVPAQLTNGWSATPPDTARFGTDYFSRAVVAAIGLGANTAEKAIYLTRIHDSRGLALDGAHAYLLHFAPGQLPPVNQFWSLTLYDQRILFYSNPLARYALGDRSSGLKRDPNGGLTIYVAHHDPGATKRSNWLPAPTGPFSLYLRLYEPKRAARTRSWTPPAVQRIR